jgi:hypothetical protein
MGDILACLTAARRERSIAAMRTVIVLAALASCGKGDETAKQSPTPAAAADAAPAAAGCKPLPDFCATLPLADLRTIFEAPNLALITGDPEVFPGDLPAGPRRTCRFKDETGRQVSFEVTARAKEDLDRARDLTSRTGQTEPVAGVGEEAFFNYTSTPTLPFVYGVLAARAGNVYVDVTKYHHDLLDAAGRPEPIAPAAARQHAANAATRLLQFVHTGN